MNGFALLWAKILRSSLWIKGSKETRLVWITMLALKDSDGFVATSLIGLADDAKVSVDECKVAIMELESPDADDTSGVDEGRRIRKVRGGWQIINHDLYRFSTEAKREFWKAQKAEQRAREDGRKQQPVSDNESSQPQTQKSKPRQPVETPLEFEAFWNVYPKREAKMKAIEAFIKNSCAGVIDKLVDAIAWQTKNGNCLDREIQFIPYPASWLNSRRWEDVSPKPQPDLMAPPKKRVIPSTYKPFGQNKEWTLDRPPVRTDFAPDMTGDSPFDTYSKLYGDWKLEYLKAQTNGNH